MKIVQMTFSLASGGAERFVVDLSNELASRGHEVYLVVFRNSLKSNADPHFYRSLIDEKVWYVNLEIQEGFSIIAFWKLFKLLKGIGPDVIHCHLDVIPYIFLLALKKGEPKYIHTLHSIASKTISLNVQRSINFFYYKTNRIHPVTISEICNSSYKKFYGLANATKIENGRSPVMPTIKISEVKSELDSYRRNAQTPIFIHVGRFSYEKNQKLLIQVFNKLANEGFKFILLIIGNGYNSPEGLNFQKQACPSIKFLGEKLNINDYFLNSDAFCLTSLYEGLPISLLEALSAGCTPICTPAGGIPSVITNGQTGYLSKDFSEESYYSVVKQYLLQPNAINKETLWRYFELNFSIKRCASEYLKLYQQV
ncbi:MAG: glycosyltransferase [Chitinophagaceae bacterium]|nr:glycosyltransferase [Chitinophagaceae bacterium]